MTTEHDIDMSLVEALRRRDPTAANQLVERYGDRVYRLALRLTGDETVAAKVVADVLRLAACQVRTLGGESFAAWIYRVATDAVYQHVPGARTSGEILPDDVLPPLDADGRRAPIDDWSKRIDARALHGEVGDVVSAAIDALPEDHRIVIALHDIEGVSYPEIAGALGVSVPIVKLRLHRSRLFVRKRISDHLAKA